MEGWTVVENAADEQFKNQLREPILQDAKRGNDIQVFARGRFNGPEVSVGIVDAIQIEHVEVKTNGQTI